MRKSALMTVETAVALAGFLLLTAVTVAGPALQELTVTAVEPTTLPQESGGKLSIYGSGFVPTATARLIGHGLLETSFVDSTALKADVPPGVEAATYALQVMQGSFSATLPSAVTVLAATQTPGPTPIPTARPTTVPGHPHLTVLNYSTDPSRVAVGREFIVTVEIYNNGSRAGENTLVTFPGGTFVPVGPAGHQLWQLHINHTATVSQRMRVPSGLSSGTYELQVGLSANDYEGSHFEFPSAVAVEVAGVGHGRPQLVVEEAETEPRVLGPGDAFSLTLRLANRGSRTATEVTVGVATSDLAVPSGGSNVIALDTLGVGRCVTTTLPLVLGDVEDAGHRNLGIALGYGDYEGGSYADQQSVGLEISTTLDDRPQMLIDGYETRPASLAPGDVFTLTLHLTNVGGGMARRLVVTLGGEAAGGLGPFAPLGSSNVKFIQDLASGASTDVEQRLAVDGSGEPGSYSLPVALAFDDTRGTRHSDSQLISLLIRQRPHLQTRFYRTIPTTTVGIPFPLPVEVTNIARTMVNVSTLELTSEALTIRDGTLYVGPLDGGTSVSLEATATAQEAGAADVFVNIHYLDDFEQPQLLTETLTVEVMEPAAPTPAPEGERQGERQEGGILRTIGRILRALLGLGS